MGLITRIKDNIIRLSVRGSFTQNVAFSLSGNALVLGIGFLLTPLVARIYGPSAYGQFAIFTAIASLIQPVSTFQLQAGYVAAKNEEEFANLIKISFITLVVISLLVLIGSLIYISVGPIQQLSGHLALLLPVYIFFASVFAIISGWNIKLEEFKRSAQSKVIATLAGKSTTLGYGWLIAQSAMGMIFGSIATFILESVGYMSKGMRASISLVYRTKFSFSAFIQTINKFSSYPKYVTTNSIVNNFSTQIPIYFIAAWYTAGKVGLFSLALSLISIPINLIGTSIGAVFLPKISAIINNTTLRNETLVALYKKLFYPGLFGLFILALALNLALPIILGESWHGASQLSSFIALSFTFTIVSIPISVTYRLINFEQANLVITIVFIFLKIAGLASGLIMGNFIYSVFGYFAANILHNASQVFFLFKKLDIRTSFIIRDLTISLTLFFFAYILTY